MKWGVYSARTSREVNARIYFKSYCLFYRKRGVIKVKSVTKQNTLILFAGYVNQSITVPRGKALGGSSVINSLIYARGNRLDYDKWASMGNPGWAYRDVLPYFKKSERTSIPGLDPGYDGHNGTWNVEYSRIFDNIGRAFLNASEEKGYKIVDYNGKNQIGCSILQVNELDGRRDSTGYSFIRYASKRSNVRISPETFVEKILINRRFKTANGVQYVRNGTRYCAKARKEVIVSAGAINTPQILMLSGIGPKKDLKKFNISVIQDLPVGRNLWDHMLLTFQTFGTNHSYEPLPQNPEENVEYIRQHVIQYLNGQGTYTSSGNEQAIAYGSPYTNNTIVPDIEYVLHSGRDSKSSYRNVFQSLYYTRESYETVVLPSTNISTVEVHPVLLHPKSRGTVKLKSDSPYDFPLIDPRYLSHPEDTLVYLAAMKYIVSLQDTDAFKRYNITDLEITHPLCKNYTYGSDDFWVCMIQNLATTTHHFSGTCKMAPESDRTGVVNNYLQVYGVGNLRVVDCSVIPTTISGHTNAVAVMIGEKASDIIKQYWRAW